MSYGKRKRQVKKEQTDQGKETGLACPNLGCDQDQQNSQVQPQAAGLAETKAAPKVIIDVIQPRTADAHVHGTAAQGI
jgi:hypothetical protein